MIVAREYGESRKTRNKKASLLVMEWVTIIKRGGVLWRKHSGNLF
jgi:hypothetical protein